MYNVLIVDFSDYKNTIAQEFPNEDYHIEIVESAFDAMAKLRSHDFDLVISEIDIPGDNAFDLHSYIKKNYPYIPIIMTTENNIDIYFDHIYKEGIGNVLSKPFSNNEILNIAEKLITKKNLFGIQNYIKDLTETQKIKITSSNEIQKAINLIIKQIGEWGFKNINTKIINLLLNEIIINAVYHSHGYTKEKENMRHVKLKDDEFVDIFYARRGNSFAISINDYRGKLTKMKILESIKKSIEQSNLILRSMETGEEISDMISETGRGLDLVRKLASEYYFVIDKDVHTEIIILFDNKNLNIDSRNFNSLKIIECD
ncbi:MAG: response regulator [Spirochaetota bacterium]|nr:response regulator [Spirochaetota bacterium]